LPRDPDILSPDEEAVLAVLREIAAGLRERGIAVTVESFGAAVLAAGAARATGSDGSPYSAYALDGVLFMAREAVGQVGSIEVSFFAERP
jgi:hypothetical protein